MRGGAIVSAVWRRQGEGVFEMRRVALVLAALAVVSVGGRVACVQRLTRQAMELHRTVAAGRVKKMLEAARPGRDFTMALALWKTGNRGAALRQSQEEYNQQVAEFRAWMAERELADTVESFEIVEATSLEEEAGVAKGTVRVVVTIDGRTAVMLVRRGEPIVWAP